MTGIQHDPNLLWILIIAMGVGTFAIRLSFLQLFEHVDTVPTRLERGFRFVPAAVLMALVLPKLVYVDGSVVLSVTNERLVAGTIGAVVAWRTEDVAATVVVGMIAVWVLGTILP